MALVRKVAGSIPSRVVRCVSSLSSAAVIHLHPICLRRAFKDILKTDRDTYGIGEDYEIGDVVADDWQQTVDDVVGGK